MTELKTEKQIKRHEDWVKYYEKKLATDPTFFERKHEEFDKRHPGRVKQYGKNHYNKNPQKTIDLVKEWRQSNLEKNNAGFAARRSGIPLKDHCEKCGTKEGKLERHHEDYSKPLEFLTICHKCHRKLHAKLRAKGVVIQSNIVGSGHCSDCAKSWPSCGKSRPLFDGSYRCTVYLATSETNEMVKE